MRYNDLSTITFQPNYRTGSNHEPQEMMKLAYGQSCVYQRAAGYFSSSIFNLFKKVTLEFAKSGGIINLMCSPVMSHEDLNQISLGYEAKKLFSGEKTSILQFKSKRKNARKPFFKARLYLDSKFKPKFEMIQPEKPVKKRTKK